MSPLSFFLRCAFVAGLMAVPATAQSVRLDDYAGYYRGVQGTFHISHGDGQLYTQGAGEPRIEVRHSGPDRFIGSPKSPFAYQFIRNRAGRVTGLRFEYRGEDFLWRRLSDAEARGGAAQEVAYLARRTPQPGTEALLRRHIAAFERGEPLYDELGEGLARGVRGGIAQFQKILLGFGRLESLTYKSTLASGADAFSSKYEKGSLEWVISPPGKDGKLQRLAFRIEENP